LSVTDEPSRVLSPWPGEPDSLVVTVDTGDRIHYLDWGYGDEDRSPLPPLVLIHGLASTAWAWTPIARRMRDATHVLALDLRGHGLSDSPRAGYDLESLAYDALTVATANGWGRDVNGPAFVVAGHGLGAMVAATMARIQPGSIAGLALIDGGWEDLAEATGMTSAEFERSTGDPPEVLASMDAYLADRREFDPATWDTDQDRAARAAVDEKHAGHVTSVVRPVALHATIDAMFTYRPLDTLATIRAPLLIAVAESGTADDEVARERLAALDDVMRARVAAGTNEATVVRFPGAGHNLMRYRADALSAALYKLLADASHQRP
jgi:pimeloyl-ACP methyl ester carboxylesterase